jgi:hypothetical protein
MSTSSYLLCPYLRVAIDYLGCYIIAFSIDTDHAIVYSRASVAFHVASTVVPSCTAMSVAGATVISAVNGGVEASHKSLLEAQILLDQDNGDATGQHLPVDDQELIDRTGPQTPPRPR